MVAAAPVSKVTATVAVLGATGAAVGIATMAHAGNSPDRDVSIGAVQSPPATTDRGVDAALSLHAEESRRASHSTVSRSGTRPVLRSVQRAAKFSAMPPLKQDVSGGVTEQVAPTDPRDIAMSMLKKYGWSSDQFSCLNEIYLRESNWNPSAENPSSGAYGIPQSLPGDKMAAYGSDWQTNPATQLAWGLAYIKDRYGSPCGAWGFWESHSWY